MPTVGIVPAQAARSSAGDVGRGDLVGEVGDVREHEEAVREALRDPELRVVLVGEHGRRTSAPKVGEPRRRSTATSKTAPRDDRARACPAACRAGSAGRAACRAPSARGCPARSSPADPGVAVARRAARSRGRSRARRRKHARLDEHDAGRATWMRVHPPSCSEPSDARAGSGRSRCLPSGSASARERRRRRCSPAGTRSPRGRRSSGPAASRRRRRSSRPRAATRACRCRARRCRATARGRLQLAALAGRRG